MSYFVILSLFLYIGLNSNYSMHIILICYLIAFVVVVAGGDYFSKRGTTVIYIFGEPVFLDMLAFASLVAVVCMGALHVWNLISASQFFVVDAITRPMHKYSLVYIDFCLHLVMRNVLFIRFLIVLTVGAIIINHTSLQKSAYRDHEVVIQCLNIFVIVTWSILIIGIMVAFQLEPRLPSTIYRIYNDPTMQVSHYLPKVILLIICPINHLISYCVLCSIITTLLYGLYRYILYYVGTHVSTEDPLYIDIFQKHRDLRFFKQFRVYIGVLLIVLFFLILLLTLLFLMHTTGCSFIYTLALVI